ncbi:STAS domain-containing protein [Kitasatospora sp. NPDC051853]|uniref:STAS domain-containing protein n=1 Tax=Kitasatospora sp. NPDC051853 TaxID=3364058 RepID=UPI0037AC9C86
MVLTAAALLLPAVFALRHPGQGWLRRAAAGIRRSLASARRPPTPVTTIRLRGEIDSRTAERTASLLAAALAAGPGGLCVDMTQVTRLTHSGAAAFVEAAANARTTGTLITVTGASPEVRRVLRGAGLDRLLQYRP